MVESAVEPPIEVVVDVTGEKRRHILELFQHIMILNLPSNIMREECCVGFNRWRKKLPALLSQVLAVLSKEAIVTFFDSTIEGVSTMSELKRHLTVKKPDVVICTVTFKYINWDSEIFRICKELDIKCIVIPIPFEYAIDLVKKYDVYFAVYSEPEKTLLDWRKGTSLAELKGIVYKDDGKVAVNPPQNPSFDKIPPIDWSSIKVKKYDSIVYQITRGCPYGCVFCEWANKRYQLKTIETVLADLQTLESYGVKQVYLLCSQITTNKKWLSEFCREKVRRGIKLLWTTDIRANELTRALARQMRTAGCIRVFMGVESVNEELLQKLNKSLRLDQMIKAIKICSEEGILINIPFMFNIGETKEQVDEYIGFLDQPLLQHSTVGTTTLHVNPGTKLFQQSHTPQKTNLIKIFKKELQKRKFKRAISRILWLFKNKNARLNLIAVLKTLDLTCLRLYSLSILKLRV